MKAKGQDEGDEEWPKSILEVIGVDPFGRILCTRRKRGGALN